MGFLDMKDTDATDLDGMIDKPYQKPSMPRVTLRMARQRPVLDFVLPGLLVQSVGLIVGQGAVGKSMLSLSIALAVASGRSIAGVWKPASTGRVTVVMAEDGVDVLQERMHFLRASEGITEDEDDEIDERMTILSGRGYDLRLMQMENGNAVLGMWYDDLLEIAKDQRLVILDPLRFLHDADENNNGAMTRFMRIVQQIARLTGATFILLHHTRKGGAGDGEDWAAASGAGAITTAARWQASLRPMNAAEATAEGIPDEMRQEWVRLAVDKINYGQQPQPTWLQRSEGGILVRGDTPAQCGEVQRSAVQYDRASNGGPSYDRPRPF